MKRVKSLPGTKRALLRLLLVVVLYSISSTAYANDGPPKCYGDDQCASGCHCIFNEMYGYQSCMC